MELIGNIKRLLGGDLKQTLKRVPSSMSISLRRKKGPCKRCN
jgi:hypothetical protein